MWLRSLHVGWNHLCHLHWDNFLWPYWWMSRILLLQFHSLSFPLNSFLALLLVWAWCNCCLPAELPSLLPFYSGSIFPSYSFYNLIFRSVTLFPLSVTGRCDWRTGVSHSPTNSVSLEFLPVSHTALLFTAFRQRIKEVCHATSWIRNGVWLPFVLHRNLALGRPSA